MRLLEASTLRLVTIRENELPPYAVLSHTWGSDEDEVSLQDLESFRTSHLRKAFTTHAVSRKIGFAKIRETARLALSQSLEFIWVDTCCIDKGSSAELSEAINSMFRWYQNSAVCYALLSDVDIHASDLGSSRLSSGNQVPFFDKVTQAVRSSRWFRRGWTLQELIAPANVHFYSQDWTFLGSKNDTNGFQSLISDITGIPIAVLDRSRSTDTLGIAERMQWASGRETTRPEDQAYCLMGIFGINMPLLYGEGIKAFIRLQEEILKGSNDQSLFAWTATNEYPAPASGLTGLLAPSPSCFKNSGHIIPLPPDTSDPSGPSAMTNIGLQIYLNLSPAGSDPGEVNAILNCAPNIAKGEDSGQGSRVAIRLTAVGRNQYVRVLSQCIFDVPAPHAGTTTDGGYSQVYVKQQPVLSLPDILLQGLNNVHAIGGNLITVWPHSQWNPSKRIIRPRGARRDGVLAGFRFKFIKSSLELTFLDIFVGISSTSEGPASWTAWCDSFESIDELPLITNVSEVESRNLGTGTKRVSLHYGIDSDPSIIFLVDRRYDQGKAILSLRVEKIHELSAARGESSAVDEFDPLTNTYEQLARPLTIEDSASISLRTSYSSLYEIRVRQLDSVLSCHQTLESIRRDASYSITDLVILKPNQTTPDAFEVYFSKLLVKACISNNITAAKELVQSHLSTALINAWTSEVHTTVKDLDPFSILEGFRPLHWAVLFGHVEMANLLLEHGADPFLDTWTGLTAIHVAIVMARFEILEQIFIAESTLKRSAPPKQLRICDTLPNFAASFIISETVTSVLKSLAAILESDGLESSFGKPNLLGETFLHRASAADNIYAVKWSVGWNTELVNFQDKRGRTPLFHAAAAGSIKACQVLLDYGAKVDITDGLGRTPLYVACRHGHDRLVDLLISTDTRSNYPVPSKELNLGFNAWHFACLSGSPDVLRALKPYANACDASRTETGETNRDDLVYPLHLASSNGDLECVKVLCNVGFSTRKRSKYTLVLESTDTVKRCVKVNEASVARTAEEWAAANGHHEVVAYLRGVQAKC